MRIRSKPLTAGIVAALIGFSAAPAIAEDDPQSNTSSPTIQQKLGAFMPPRLGTSIRNGTILAASTTHMIVSHTQKGKTEALEFVLDSETLRSGEIVVGAHVTVHYRMENNQNIATSIQVRKASLESL